MVWKDFNALGKLLLLSSMINSIHHTMSFKDAFLSIY